MIKNKLKEEQGITLIALIITIIILVILAAVSIRAAYNSGIIDYSINGTKKYQEESKKEESVISETEEKLKSLINRIEDPDEEDEETKDYDDNWIIAWVFNDEDEGWSNPYSKEEGVLDAYFQNIDDDFSIQSEAEVDNATLRALLYENEKDNPNDETTYTLVMSGTGNIPSPVNSGDGQPWNGYYHTFIDGDRPAWRCSDNYWEVYGNISRVEIREGITSVDEGAFCTCGASYLYVPGSVEEIGYQAFDSTAFVTVEFNAGFHGEISIMAFHNSDWITTLVNQGIAEDLNNGNVSVEINGNEYILAWWYD